MDVLFDPPLPVVPMGPWGYVGCSAVLVIGMAILVAVAWLADDVLAPGPLLATLVGAAPIAWGEYRFFRAIGPDSWPANTAMWVCALAVPIALAIVLAAAGAVRAGGAGLVAVVPMGAAFVAGVFDRLAEHMAAVPVALGTLLVVALILIVIARDR